MAIIKPPPCRRLRPADVIRPVLPPVAAQVKLKYKMPFPIEVHSRRSDFPVQPPPPPAPPVAAAEDRLEEVTVASSPPADETSAADDGFEQPAAESEFSFISIGGSVGSAVSAVSGGVIGVIGQ